MNLQQWWHLSAREHIKKYLRLTGFRRIYEITFWLTHRCVYNCKFCVIEENGGPFLPKEAIFAIIQEALPYKLGTAPITGGEPMLHPDFAEICHYVQDHVPSVGIHVTGRLINDDTLKEMERRGRRWNWWLTIVSHDREINDRYRAKGSFEDAVRASQLLRKRGHAANLAINVLPETLDHLEETIRYAFEELKSPVVTTEPIGPMGRAVKDPDTLLMNDEQLHSYYRLMTDLIPQWKERGHNLDAINVIYGLPQRCEFLWRLNGFNVHPTGLVSPCCYFLEEDGSIGIIEEGVRKCTSLSRGLALEKRMEATHINVEERVRKVGIWSCFECLLNYQIHNKGRTDLKR